MNPFVFIILVLIFIGSCNGAGAAQFATAAKQPTPTAAIMKAKACPPPSQYHAVKEYCVADDKRQAAPVQSTEGRLPSVLPQLRKLLYSRLGSGNG